MISPGGKTSVTVEKFVLNWDVLVISALWSKFRSLRCDLRMQTSATIRMMAITPTIVTDSTVIAVGERPPCEPSSVYDGVSDISVGDSLGGTVTDSDGCGVTDWDGCDVTDSDGCGVADSDGCGVTDWDGCGVTVWVGSGVGDTLGGTVTDVGGWCVVGTIGRQFSQCQYVLPPSDGSLPVNRTLSSWLRSKHISENVTDPVVFPKTCTTSLVAARASPRVLLKQQS